MTEPLDPASGAAPEGAPSDAATPTAEQVKLALRKVKDPELNLNIIDLGLVYDVMVEDRTAVIAMTLTSPGCPAGPQIMADAERAVRNMPGVDDVVVNLVWEPYWTPERIEPRVRAYMGL
ncbi:MAG: metal-sulfur cluster assembly factor [Gemmatimonadota bacterium]|nr:metal-sulfur cluster assembly factor [Gemmatimonadota bacterium]MDE3127200.1 metal-sulfur cluster assembly factor [Gemmatimonadota bacterium]MDE3171608.1 metal-sulfur cluster assembly factor [Gemmatimonadota bacterium]MDE3216054.1 metal-sulfur cluster assembly factor [Gemmatimonadota bacterium]